MYPTCLAGGRGGMDLRQQSDDELENGDNFSVNSSQSETHSYLADGMSSFVHIVISCYWHLLTVTVCIIQAIGSLLLINNNFVFDD